jgi:release factor glutamine methyltransferase
MYYPREDSYFLSEAIYNYLKKRNKNISVLDIGTGTGIQAENMVKLGIKKENILSSDIDSKAVNFVRKKGIRAVKSNLFSNIKGRLSEGKHRCPRFDIIVFNPPYLPENKYDKEKDITGGKKGDETILSFLKQANKHMNKNCKIFLLLSSFTPKSRIEREIKKQNLNKKILAEKKLFFETSEIRISDSYQKALLSETLEVWLISF